MLDVDPGVNFCAPDDSRWRSCRLSKKWLPLRTRPRVPRKPETIQNPGVLNLQHGRRFRRHAFYIGIMHQRAPPSFLVATAPRLASDDAAGEESQLVYLEIRIPRAMHDAVVRHHSNLITLSDALRGAAMPAAMIAAHVDCAIASYRDALVASLASREVDSSAR